MGDIWELFDTKTEQWFTENLGEPTAVQKQAWPAIAGKNHTLVSAPTGTGKTLSAFLIFLDRLCGRAREGKLPRQLQLIYISPLKSLAADIRENLERPLAGIGGDVRDQITIAVRTGDTPQKGRQQMLRRPPHILITTPESLYLMLTGKKSCRMLATAEAVILDELHVMIDTKRGAHLMLSLARLDALCGRPCQRIGLSATMEPLETAARYLAPEPVILAAPKMNKRMELQVLGPYAGKRKQRKETVWEELAALVYQYCLDSRSVLAFVEGRRYAEKLAYHVNRLGGEGFAAVHHGSLSAKQRQETEEALRDGRLRLLCATSSMELGIDVGQIDRVIQVGCPGTVSGTLQRLGRAGHNPDRVSSMLLFPRTAGECLTCAMTAVLAAQGRVERLGPPTDCLDVLAQHLVSMACVEPYSIDDVMELLKRAWPFRQLTREDVHSVLAMLAGDYEHEQDLPVRSRILYDRIHGRVEGDGYSRLLAVSAGGTIPDKGLYAVKTETGETVGEVDEEFVYETRKGDRFLLGTFAWQVLSIDRNTVTVTRTAREGAKLPFWKGEIRGRDRLTGEAFGRILQRLQLAYEENTLYPALRDMGMDEPAARLTQGYLTRQIQTLGGLANHRTIYAEHFHDRSGNSQIMIHSVFGRRINAPLGLLLAREASERLNRNVGSVDAEDGILLYSYGEGELPEGLLQRMDPETCRERLAAMLPATPLFNMAFRYNSGRALMMGVRKNGRQPLWIQRLRGAQMLDQVVRYDSHPLIRETRHECMEELWDADGLVKLLASIRDGLVSVREVYTRVASPMSLPLQWEQEAAVMYDYSPTPDGVREAVSEAVKRQRELPAGLQPDWHKLEEAGKRSRLPESPAGLHALLMAEGDLAAGELAIPADWLEILSDEGRVCYLEQGLWIAAEQEEEYGRALCCGLEEDRLKILRRMLRCRGACDARAAAARYGWEEEETARLLETLRQRGEAVWQEGLFYHRDLYRMAVWRTLHARREEIQTCPGENYAALMAAKTVREDAPAEQVRQILQSMTGRLCPAGFWEGVLLTGRIRGYRESMLDQLLAEGTLFWHMQGKELRFDLREEVDWDAPVEEYSGELTEEERIVYEALLQRGASFAAPLNRLLAGGSAYEPLLSLMEKGLVCADSFVPVRQWLAREKTAKSSARVRAGLRVKALQSGRWEAVRPLKSTDEQKQLDRCMSRCLVMSRQTADYWGLNWQEALKTLRIWEYTGQVRRGYFVEGLSGIQFIKKEDFDRVTRLLEKPEKKLLWLNAADPDQIRGKILAHREGEGFLNVPGTAVALYAGLPAVILERQGRILRIIRQDQAEEALRQLVVRFREGTLFAVQKRLVVKDYPPEAEKLLSGAGFIREMQDYVLYR